MGVHGTLAARVDRPNSSVAAEKSCIFILLCGGPSHLDTGALKPDAPKPLSTGEPIVELFG